MYLHYNNLKVRSNNNQTFFKNAKSKTKRYDLKHPVTRYLLLLELASVFVFVSKILCALWSEIPIIVQKFETSSPKTSFSVGWSTE